MLPNNESLYRTADQLKVEIEQFTRDTDQFLRASERHRKRCNLGWETETERDELLREIAQLLSESDHLLARQQDLHERNEQLILQFAQDSQDLNHAAEAAYVRQSADQLFELVNDPWQRGHLWQLYGWMEKARVWLSQLRRRRA